MSDELDAEMFAQTLNALGIWESMLSQIATQQIYVTPNCIYFDHFDYKIMDAIISLRAMNAHYARLYEKFKEENEQNG